MTNPYQSNIWKIYVFKLLRGLFFVSGILIPFYTDWGGINFTQILILQSWFLIWGFLLEIPTGTIADYLGRKHSLIFGSISTIIGVVLYVSAPNFYMFLLGEFFFAMSTALISGADEAFTYDTLKKLKKEKESKKVFARMESFYLIGLLISAPIGSLVAAHYGLRAPWLLMVIPFTLATIIGFTFKEPKTKQKIESKRYLEILKEGIKYFYGHKILKILALDYVVIAVMGYYIIWLYQAMLMKAGVDIIYFGFVHAAFVLSQILIMNNFEFFEKLFGSKKGFIFASALITGLMFIIGAITSYVPAVLLVIIVAAGFSLSRRPLFQNYMNKYIGSDKRATVLSTVSMISKFSLAILNPIIGLLVDWSLSYTLLILGLIAILFSVVSKVKEEHLID